MTAAVVKLPIPTIATKLSVNECPAGWNDYVQDHAEGTLFHLSGWLEAIKASYGYDAFYLAVYRDDEIAGVLPLVHVCSPLLGDSLISTAFTVGGGPIGSDAIAMSALLEEAEKIGNELNVQYIECRSDFGERDGWIPKTGLYANFSSAIPQDYDENLKMIPRKRRAEVRKGIKAKDNGDVTVRNCQDVDAFYPIYAASVHALGTPVFPKAFLENVVSEFSGQCEILFVEQAGEAIAGLLNFSFGNQVMPYYVGAAKGAEGKAKSLRAFDLLYWETMRRAVDCGLEIFDFGRSKIGTGPFEFKKLWGMEPQPLTYRVKLERASTPPNVSPSNAKFATVAKLWTRMPLSAANRLGPLLAPNFP